MAETKTPTRKGMEMYTPRDYALRSLFGYVIDFKANEPQIVPHRAVEEAIAIGAVFTNATEQRLNVTERPQVVEPPMGFERKQKLFDVMAAMAELNSPEDFTPGSKPKLDAVKAKAGFDVDRKEVNEIWNEVMQAKANAS